MLGLPAATEINKPLPKTLVYKHFALTAQQCDRFDADISRIAIVNVVSPQTIPALAEGVEVKSLYVLSVSLKRKGYDEKNIIMLAKLIPQHLLFVLRYDDEIRLAVFHDRLFVSQWQKAEEVAPMRLEGLGIDAVWVNIVTAIGGFSLEGENSLKEQIRQNEAQAKLHRQIERLERRCRHERQPRRKAGLFEELKKLKQLLDNGQTENAEP